MYEENILLNLREGYFGCITYFDGSKEDFIKKIPDMTRDCAAILSERIMLGRKLSQIDLIFKYKDERSGFSRHSVGLKWIED